MSNPGLIERARQMLNAASHSSAGQYPARHHDTKKATSKAANHTTTKNHAPIWMETEASVNACRREFVKINAFRSGREHEINTFTVSFTYYAHARTYFDRLASTEAKAQGECFSIFYNAFDPKQNRTSGSDLDNGSPVSAVGVAACILVSIMVLMMTHP